jgi:predicted Zn-dependent peptidase
VLSPAEAKRRVAQVTAAQVGQVAREYLRPERLSLALVSPLKSDKGLMNLISL